MGILTVTPADQYLGASDFNTGQLLLVVVSFGLGSCFTGVVLTARAVDGSMALINMDFPTVASWRWRHQLIISVCMACLAVSDAIVRSEARNIPAYLSGLVAKSPAFTVSVLLLSFTSASLSTLLTLHEVTFKFFPLSI
jgi:ABC-type Fe3+-siderophore transport system permease subunit